jgi:hypothetical protein
LCAPTVEALVGAVTAAVPLALAVDPSAQHAAVRRMAYDWGDVARRTETVYDAAAARPRPSVVKRLRRYATAVSRVLCSVSNGGLPSPLLFPCFFLISFLIEPPRAVVVPGCHRWADLLLCRGGPNARGASP